MNRFKKLIALLLAFSLVTTTAWSYSYNSGRSSFSSRTSSSFSRSSSSSFRLSSPSRSSSSFSRSSSSSTFKMPKSTYSAPKANATTHYTTPSTSTSPFTLKSTTLTSPKTSTTSTLNSTVKAPAIAPHYDNTSYTPSSSYGWRPSYLYYGNTTVYQHDAFSNSLFWYWLGTHTARNNQTIVTTAPLATSTGATATYSTSDQHFNGMALLLDIVTVAILICLIVGLIIFFKRHRDKRNGYW